MTLRRNLIWCRLSRDDDRLPGTTGDKLAGQEAACRRLAEQYGIDPIHQVVVERVSGGALAKRPDLLRLLLECRRGEIDTILCTFPDRLSRLDGRDRVDFEEALTEGGVTVITTTGVTRYHLDEEPFGRRVLAEAAAYELRAYGRRKRERNSQKLQENRRYAGAAPYGYRSDPAAKGGYATIPHEYVVLVRIFRDVLAGRSLRGLADELNREGIPPPYHRSTGRGTVWRHSTIRRLCLNSLYAGRHCKRVTTIQGGQHRDLAPDDYVISPIGGEWEHPISYEQYLELRAQFAGRRLPAPPEAILTGVLYCQAGQRMTRDGKSIYGCHCTEAHPGRAVNRERIERYALAVIRHVVDNLPAGAMGVFGEGSVPREEILRDHAKAQRTLREARETVDDMQRNAQRYIGLFGMEAFEASARRAALIRDHAQVEEGRLAALVSEPAAENVEPLLERIRAIGLDRLWEMLTDGQRRELVRCFVARIELAPKPAGSTPHRVPILTLAGWVRRVGIDTPVFRLGKV